MNILFSLLGIPRTIGIWIDSIVYGLIDNAYNLIYFFASKELFESGTIEVVMRNMYVIIGIFALFRLAVLLVNSIINPDKLFDETAGLSKIAANTIIMLLMLVAVPFAFNEAREIQDLIVTNNYINSLFGQKETVSSVTKGPKTDTGINPGKTMEKIAISSLIYPDERLYLPYSALYSNKTWNGTDGFSESDLLEIDGEVMGGFSEDCTGKCKDQITEYVEMMNDGSKGVNWLTLSNNAGTHVKVDGDLVFIYNYKMIITLIAGGFIVYIMFSFAIDIAVRAVELAALEIMAPLFIVTYIDPKSAKSGPFHNWLTTVGKVYASLFIKLATIALLFLFIGLIDKIQW